MVTLKGPMPARNFGFRKKAQGRNTGFAFIPGHALAH